MGTDKKTQIKIIKQGMAGSICSVSGWEAEFKEGRRPDPRIRFQTLFKEALTLV
jgi:hypothetical protein